MFHVTHAKTVFMIWRDTISLAVAADILELGSNEALSSISHQSLSTNIQI